MGTVIFLAHPFALQKTTDFSWGLDTNVNFPTQIGEGYDSW